MSSTYRLCLAAEGRKAAERRRSTLVTAATPVEIIGWRLLRHAQRGLVGYFVETWDTGVDNDFVPLRGSMRVVADGDIEADFSGQGGELYLPQPVAVAVGAAGIGGDHQRGGVGIAGGAHGLPPAADGVDGDRPGVVVVTDAHPALVAAHVVDPIGNRFGHLGIGEIVDVDAFGPAFGLPLPPSVGLGVVDQFLLLAIAADHRLARGQALTGQSVDVLELAVAVRVLGTLYGLGGRLEAVAHGMQQVRHRPLSYLMAHILQGSGQLASRLERPAQRRHRIAPRIGLDPGRAPLLVHLRRLLIIVFIRPAVSAIPKRPRRAKPRTSGKLSPAAAPLLTK